MPRLRIARIFENWWAGLRFSAMGGEGERVIAEKLRAGLAGFRLLLDRDDGDRQRRDRSERCLRSPACELGEQLPAEERRDPAVHLGEHRAVEAGRVVHQVG